jgi:hypothetical protein
VKRHLKWVAIACIAGSIFPIAYLYLYSAGAITAFPSWGPWLWPSSIMLLATDGLESDHLYVAEIIAISLLVNAALWALMGLAVSWVLKTGGHSGGGSVNES